MPRKQKQRRSVCPVACTLDVLGDKWTLIVIRDLLCGRASFQEFLESPERIATNILSDRLARLVGSGLVETAPSTVRSDRHTYRLTSRGRALTPVLEAIRDWGLAHIPGTQARLLPRAAEQ
ncbi:MAG: helix-turn-helix transcriptional regulator [Phycisphaeraceae bacterium]|nr:helix-turn-helix transcriptional regulator [Phycisphaerae bacterium]MBX3393409.1 helix-turn-helix transcriptional regulator [Phycisphaeraceae bacterium]